MGYHSYRARLSVPAVKSLLNLKTRTSSHCILNWLCTYVCSKKFHIQIMTIPLPIILTKMIDRLMYSNLRFLKHITKIYLIVIIIITQINFYSRISIVTLNEYEQDCCYDSFLVSKTFENFPNGWLLNFFSLAVFISVMEERIGLQIELKDRKELFYWILITFWESKGAKIWSWNFKRLPTFIISKLGFLFSVLKMF